MARRKRNRNQEKKTLADVHQKWEGLLRLRDSVICCVSAKRDPAVTGSTVFLSSFANNLLFIHAVAALEAALEYIRDSGRLVCSSNSFYALLLECQQREPHEIDFRTLQEIREKRNSLAHDGVIIDSEDCWRYVDVIASTLQQLGCLPSHATTSNVLGFEADHEVTGDWPSDPFASSDCTTIPNVMVAHQEAFAMS
jgi:hypothetical protein